MGFGNLGEVITTVENLLRLQPFRVRTPTGQKKCVREGAEKGGGEKKSAESQGEKGAKLSRELCRKKEAW